MSSAENSYADFAARIGRQAQIIGLAAVVGGARLAGAPLHEGLIAGLMRNQLASGEGWAAYPQSAS